MSSTLPALLSTPVTLTVPPVWPMCPMLAAVKLSSRFSVPPLTKMPLPLVLVLLQLDVPEVALMLTVPALTLITPVLFRPPNCQVLLALLALSVPAKLMVSSL